MNVNLRIDRLVLDGMEIAPEQCPVLQAAVETELSRLLTEGGLSPSLARGVAVPRLSARDIPMASASSPTELGHRIAQSVYGGIGHE
ncbi:MAG: hypothetical protein LV473_07810 [Nitrospira sp.]|nr:hypothetical protein [Nitrospira sp.]